PAGDPAGRGRSGAALLSREPEPDDAGRPAGRHRRRRARAAGAGPVDTTEPRPDTRCRRVGPSPANLSGGDGRRPPRDVRRGRRPQADMTDHPPVTLRPATAADEALLLVWANDVGTRAAGFRPDPISAEDHRRWLADRLGSASG